MNDKVQGRTLTVIMTGPNNAKVGDTVTFHARVVEGTPPIKYKWSVGPGNTDTITLTETKPGKYVIQVDVIDNTSMVGSDMLLFEVEGN